MLGTTTWDCLQESDRDDQAYLMCATLLGENRVREDPELVLEEGVQEVQEDSVLDPADRDRKQLFKDLVEMLDLELARLKENTPEEVRL